MMSALQMDISTSSRFQRFNSNQDSREVIDYSKGTYSRMPPEGRIPPNRVPTKGMRKAYPEDQYVSPASHNQHNLATSESQRMDQSYPPLVYSTISNNTPSPNSYYSSPPSSYGFDHRFNFPFDHIDEPREYQCLKCGIFFSQESDLHIHYTQDHGYGQGPTDDTVGNGVTNRGQQSTARNAGQEMFCDKCQLRFHCPLSFRVHQHEHVLPNVQPHYPLSNSHLLSLSYTCEICGANFMSRESLTDHANAHLCEHVCSESTCGESDGAATNSSEDFYQRESYQYHKGYMDPSNVNIDTDSSQNLHHMEQHQSGTKAEEHMHVNQGPNPYSPEYSPYRHEVSSPISSSKTSASGVYDPLIVMDNGKRRFQCVICKKYLSSRIAHEEHTRGKHTGDKPYTCSYCGKRFAVWNTYKHHMNTHKGGQTPLQKCNMCDKRFKTIECLRNHMQREHNCTSGLSGEGNPSAGYSCQICGKTFVRKMWRTRHYLSHAGQNCFRCELCSCILPDEQSYRVHHESHKASN